MLRLSPFASLLLALPAAAQAPEATLEPGAAALPGRWSVAGGSASGSGVSLAPPLRHEPEVAWTVRLRGEVEGEPLVWDGSVLVAVEEGPGRRALQALELGTGRTLLHQLLPARQPLEPSLWSDRVAVRPEPDHVDVYRMRTGRLFEERSVRGRESVSRPLLVDGELILRVDDALVLYELGRREPRWTAQAEGVVRGDPALRGDAVHALVYDERGNASVQSFERRTGRLLATRPAGHHGGEVPGALEPAGVTALSDAVLLDYPRPPGLEDGREVDRMELLDEPGSRPSYAGVLRTPPTEAPAGWIALEVDEEERWLWNLAERDGRARVLGRTGERPELAAPVPATRSGDILYVGGLAVDLETFGVLWRRPAAPRFRPVPADGRLLVVEEERALVCLREPPPAAGSPAAAVREAEARVESVTAERLAQLAHESLRLRDAALSRRLVDEAVRRGARGRTVDTVRDAIDRLGEASAAADERRLAPLLERERKLLATPAHDLYELARGARSGALTRGYLRACLERAPDHEEARAAARMLVPDDAPVTEPFDAASWLDFLDATEGTPVRFLDPGAKGLSGEHAGELALVKAERERWRGDLIGLRSERLLVVTPPDRPGAVARCLEVGELVCDVLEELFGRRRGAAPPLVLLLYPTREEYLDQSRRAESLPEAALGWTAGHYSGRDNLSRVFVPAEDVELERLLGTYAHELTHHWLATRASFAARAMDPGLPYWLVEGIASMVEEFRLDPRAGTWEAVQPRADSLDTIANARPEDLLPWNDLVMLDQRAFERLSPEGDVPVPMTWQLGGARRASQVTFFYAQAGALCHALFADPALRPRLLAFVAAWYRSERAATEFRAAFGLSAEEMGRRALEHARRTVSDS